MRYTFSLAVAVVACSTAPAGLSTTGALEASTSTSTADASLTPTEVSLDLGADESGANTLTNTSSDPCILAPAGCEPCMPGQYQCRGDLLQACTGSGWSDVQTCDTLMGLSCDPGGFCFGACSDLGASNVGCDYYPITTTQDPSAFADNSFAVAVVNAGGTTATVTVTYDGDVIASESALSGSMVVILLPRITALTHAQDTVLVQGGAYRLRSTAPVTVYQYNTLKKSSSNDASVLLPVNTWTGRYVVASWHHWDAFNSPGMIAVTASEDDTAVTLVPGEGGTPTDPGDGVAENGHALTVLNAGDVLQVLTKHGGDFTGMQVMADKPVQVLGGHQCSAVPSESFACDHLEEVMLPFEALGREYVVVPPVQWPDVTKPKATFVRIVAAEDGATLNFSPDQQVAKYLASTGDFLEVGPTIEAFVVSSDKRLVVAQYMVSQEFGFGLSDPSMVLVIPREQHRKSYRLYGDTSWTATFVDIVAPSTADVHVDGVALLNFIQVGDTGFKYTHAGLSNAADGVHEVVATSAVGVSVYGLGDYGSYWHPGGLDVGPIAQ